jgi:ATP-dependent protease ClpP protease subunit
MSAAILILAACHKRLSFEHSYFLLHGIRREKIYISSLSKNLDEIFAKEKESFKEMFSFYDSTILSSFPISAHDYHEFSHDGNEFERLFHSKKALELGIIDEIIQKFPF